MAAAKRKIELVGALINDIRDEDIQAEIRRLYADPQRRGESDREIHHRWILRRNRGLLALYKGLIQQFEEEYEPEEKTASSSLEQAPPPDTV